MSVTLLDKVVLNPAATTAHTVEALVAGGASVTADDVALTAKSSGNAVAEVDTFGFSALSGITSMNPTAGGRAILRPSSTAPSHRRI